MAAGMNPMDLFRGINLATQEVIKALDTVKKDIETNEEIEQVRSSFLPF